jgi:hypothetical protein
MKRNSLLLFWLIFVFAVNNFSQTKTPLEVANEFCNLALNNDFESAKKHLESKSFVGIKLESLKIDFRIVKGFKKLSLINQDISPVTAKFVFNAKSVTQIVQITVNLAKTVIDWKITKFNVKTSWDARVYINEKYGSYMPNFQPNKEKTPQILPLEPYNEKKNPAKILAEPYYPNKNPAIYEFIPKKP